MMWKRGNGTEAAQNGAIIKVQQLTKRYEGVGDDVVALKRIDMDVRAGEFLVVTGKSGAGKTTLVNMLTGLDRATSGEVWVNGQPVHRLSAGQAARWRGETVGVVFQSFELLPSLTVLHNVMLPMDFAHKLSIRERRERAGHLLEQVGIADHAQKRPGEVSGGQRQRVGIARAMANDPPILVADEPTGSLDSATTDAVLDVFERLAGQGKTVFLVTHDADIVERGTRTITLADGEIIGSRE